MTRRIDTPCRVPGCDGRGNESGLCHAHNQWKRNHGVEPTHLIARHGRPAEDRFWPKVALTDTHDCWIWTSSTRGNGRYGAFQGTQAHGWSYEHWIGLVPTGLELDHLCRVTLCVNPWHLEPVTHLENILRGVSLQAENARKTHCIRGHEFTPANIITLKRGGRQCRACSSARNEWRNAMYHIYGKGFVIADVAPEHRVDAYLGDYRQERAA